MKHILNLALICAALVLTPSCANQPGQPSATNLIAAITPATSVLVAEKPALIAPLKTAVAAIQKVAATDSVTPTDLLASLTNLQRKNPEVFAIVQLVSAAYSIQYSPSANNLATLTSLADAIQQGLPADPPAP